jgi:hypothetical protein
MGVADLEYDLPPKFRVGIAIASESYLNLARPKKELSEESIDDYQKELVESLSL